MEIPLSRYTDPAESIDRESAANEMRAMVFFMFSRMPSIHIYFNDSLSLKKKSSLLHFRRDCLISIMTGN